MKMTINEVEQTYNALPNDTSGFYTHYDTDDGNGYIHLDVDVKNLGKQNLSYADLMKATAGYSGGYTYSGLAAPEDSSSGFTYADITTIPPWRC